MVGPDGFVDKIVTPVDKRHGLEENFDPIETIADLGSRISAAAGKSANIGFYPALRQTGWKRADHGQRSSFSRALAFVVGPSGDRSSILSSRNSPEKTEAVSLAGPGITTAAEFKDGKLMFGNMRGLGN